MGNEKTKPKGMAEPVETVEKETTAKAAPAPKFLIRKLREQCIKLFGVTTSTFDGAMYGIEETELSIDEAKAIIDHFLYGGNE